MARTDYTPPTFVDVPNPASPPAGAVALDAARLNAMAQAIANSAAAVDVGGHSGDRIRYVSKSGNDSRDGLTLGTAMLTIQHAIEDVAAVGGEVRVGAGTFTEIITVRSGVSVIGAGENATIIKPPAGSTSPGAIVLAAGPVDNVRVGHFALVGNGNSGQHGIYLRSVPQAPDNNGGLWWSSLSHIDISGFRGCPLWLRGGGTSYLIPHQFLTLELVRAHGTVASGWPVAIFSGQVGQVDLVQCQFDSDATWPGASTTGKPNVLITQELGDDGVTELSNTAPYSLSFHTATLQNGFLAAYVRRGSAAIRFTNPHLENCRSGFLTDTTASLTIEGGVLANVAVTDGSGYWVKSDGVANVLVTGGIEGSGAVDKTFVSASEGQLVVRDSRTDGNLTVGLTRQLGVGADGTLAVGSRRTAIVNASATAITGMSASLNPGELVHLRAFGGTITFANSSTLDVSGRTSPLTIADGVIATFTRFDLLGKWMLVSLSA